MIEPRLRLPLAAVLTTALAVALVWTVEFDGYRRDPGGLSWRYALCWALFAAAAWAVRRAPVRRAVALILAGSALVAVTGLVAPPRTSTDAYRYAWDGRVQASGTSPYDYVPAAPELAPLRDAWLFPTGAACAGPDRARLASPAATPHCTRLNRPTVHTIYPPLAESYFYGVQLLSPHGARLKPLQIGGAVLSVAVTGALLLVLRRRGDPRTAAYWAWCPAVPVEAVNNAHVDVLGVLFTVAGLGAVTVRRARGGALLGAAVAAKLVPAVVLPGALSGVRRPRDAAAVLLPAAAVLALCYLPYLLASHDSVLGYLSGYLNEEGYRDASAGSRYALLRLLLPDAWALPVLVVVLIVLCGGVLWRGSPERPWCGALLVTGAAFLLLTPGYSWYALLLIALVALDGRWEWLAVAAAGTVAYVTARAFPAHGAVATTAYALAAASVGAGWLVRRRAAAVSPRRPGRTGACLAVRVRGGRARTARPPR
ncbi:glycosyltransferase 87 family protein [Streptomyces noursei]|uniref:glycosyltransferase 87 family protein n=1 Tax=Streptomyces noursei TaxID=1971 RepID=UPI0036B8CBA3